MSAEQQDRKLNQRIELQYSTTKKKKKKKADSCINIRCWIEMCVWEQYLNNCRRRRCRRRRHHIMISTKNVVVNKNTVYTVQWDGVLFFFFLLIIASYNALVHSIHIKMHRIIRLFLLAIDWPLLLFLWHHVHLILCSVRCNLVVGFIVAVAWFIIHWNLVRIGTVICVEKRWKK